VPLDCAGKRFDQALAEMFPEYSRSRLAEWIRSGDARLGGEMVRPRDPVRGGETVHLALRTEVETDALRAFKRQALHAEKLEFVHPVSGETVTTNSALPADMQALVATLRADTANFNAEHGKR
jgi:23S rRNA-/tRNA-specific pseudouridylate synthase